MDHDDEYESNNEGETILLENMEAASEDSDRRELLPPSSQEEYRPKDKCHIVYIVIIIVSTGLLFPYNSYIVGLDYFQYLYPDDRTEFILPLSYLLTTLIFVTVTIGIVNYAPLHARILLGYVLFIISLLLVPLLDIGVNNCTVSPTIGFILTCLTFVIVGIGSGVQQSSYYGLAGMLPERFTQAMMLGESLAGTLVSISRIITKATSGSERIGAIVFFVISLLFMLFCMGCQAFLWKSSFVRHYVDIAKSKQAIDDNSEQPLMAATSVSSQNRKTCFSLKNWPDKIIRGILARWQILRKVWKLIIVVFITFFITLWVFPGLTSLVQDCNLGSWPSVILAFIFNFTDFLSRLFARIPFHWKPRYLMLGSLARILLVPLFLLCVVPSPTYPVINHPLWLAAVLSAILGATNGYIGTLGMQYAPQMVDNNQKELTGIIMVFFLLGGLTMGSILANVWSPLVNLKPHILCSNVTAEFNCTVDNLLWHL